MKERIRWLRDEGLVYYGMWEPIYFQKLRGGASDAAEKAYLFRHSPEFVEWLAAEGYTQLWTHFFKGCGLQFEREEMERNRELVRLCHEKGVRVVAYCTFGSLTPDTILIESPEAEEWFQVNEEGRHTSNQVTHQNFRVRPCYNALGWREYMKRVVEYALEMGMDGIHFDNIGYNAEPDSCKCSTCTRLFREFLAEEYSGSPEKEALGRERFGFTDFSHASFPWFNRWNQAISQRVVRGTLQQEWTRFKIASLTGAVAEIAEHIRSVNPDALVEANAGKAMGINVQMWNGISPEELYPHLDLLFNESGGLRVNEKGALVSRVREMKLARAGGTPVIMYSRGEAELAETIAFGQGSFAGGGGRELNEYFHKVRRYAARTETLAELAVLYHAETLRYSVNEPYESFVTLTQVLIERHIPFDIVHGRDLNELSRYRLLVLPDVECLSDGEARAILAFVEAGGAVLATENTGRHDDWRRPRVHRDIDPRSMEDLGRLVEPKNALAGLWSEDSPRGPVRREHGKGRAAYVPRLDYVERMGTAPEVWMYDSRYWAEPGNADELLDAVAWLLPEPRFRVKGEGKFLFEPLVVTDTGEWALHVVCLHPESEHDVTIEVRPDPEPKEVVRMDRPRGERPAEVERSRGSLRIRMEGLTFHNLVVLRGVAG